MVNAPDLSLRGPNGAVAISGKHCRFVPTAGQTHAPCRGMPLPAPHERLVPVAVTMVNASDLSLRGPNGAVAISGRQLRFRRGLPVIQLCTARLPRRFAPRNDTSGSAAVHQRPPAVEWLCTRRSVTALQAVGFAARIRWRKVNKFVIARPQRGRGALSAKREEVPLGCNLGKAVTFSPGPLCYPAVYCEIATAPLGPRNDNSGVHTIFTMACIGL